MVASVAQWIRALVFGTRGRGFESLQRYQLDFERDGGRFELL